MSVRPLLDDEKFEKLKEMSEEFKNGVGKKLQLYLWLKSWWSSNYVSINCRLAITILNFLCLFVKIFYLLLGDLPGISCALRNNNSNNNFNCT